MFAAEMTEAASKRVSIEDFDAEVVEQFISYVHTDSIDTSLKVPALELLMIADKYDVRGLKNLAQKQLIKSLSLETVCATFELVTMINSIEALQAACNKLICNNRDAIDPKAIGNCSAIALKFNFFLLFSSICNFTFYHFSTVYSSDDFCTYESTINIKLSSLLTKHYFLANAVHLCVEDFCLILYSTKNVPMLSPCN